MVRKAILASSKLLGKFIPILLLCSLLASCIQFPPIQLPTPSLAILSSPTPEQPLAEIIFNLNVPTETLPDAKITLEILDEVTGLGLNPTWYSLTYLGKQQYQIKIPLPINSVIKYRFFREGTPPVYEMNGTGEAVRYRLFYVSTPGQVSDMVTRWTGTDFKAATGRLQGQVLDGSTGKPIPDIMISSGGQLTLTAMDGSFVLNQLMPGTHILTAYAMDGSYLPFSQGATIAEASTTPAPLVLSPARKVKVSFIVHVPAEEKFQTPLRLAGDILQLGDSFTSLAGGMSISAFRAPEMALQSNGTYKLALDLPAGLTIHYKYSLGDGFWNAEHKKDGRFQLRTLVIPQNNITIEDSIDTWKMENSAPIVFNVQVPTGTPAADQISIQFNPYGWTAPLPMRKSGDNNWTYTLFSPMSLFSNIGYRFCRNSQCGSADDAATAGNASKGLTFSSSHLPQSFHYDVQQWKWWQPSDQPTPVIADNAISRNATFITGVEWSPNYSTELQPFLQQSIKETRELGSNTLVLSPTWHVTENNPPMLQQIPGKDALLGDWAQIGGWSKDENLNTIWFPQITFSGPGQDWWQTGVRDPDWWQRWFNRYQAFVLYYADLAQASRAGALILGDPGVTPSITGTLANGSQAGNPVDLAKYWTDLIKEVRTHYTGAILWALPYKGGAIKVPKAATDVDGYYLLWDAPLVSQPQPTVAQITQKIGAMLDADVKPFQDKTGKPLIIGIEYPSASGAAQGCIRVDATCVRLSEYDKNGQMIEKSMPDMQAQADVYNAAFSAINQRSWINGLVSRWFTPGAALQDASASINGKPAANVVWYWFSKFLAKP